MTKLPLIGMVLACGVLADAQEREVPRDSARVSIAGCAKDRTFISARSEHAASNADVEPGSRFRLNGPKKLLEEIKRQERQQSMVEVTGLVRKSQLGGPGGISIAGGRIRLGGATPRDRIRDPARDPAYNQVVFDVESWRPLPDSCPAR